MSKSTPGQIAASEGIARYYVMRIRREGHPNTFRIYDRNAGGPATGVGRTDYLDRAAAQRKADNLNGR